MKKRILSFILILLFFSLLNGKIFRNHFSLFLSEVEATNIAQINATIRITVCGNGELESNEYCDDGSNNRWYGFYLEKNRGYCLPDCSGYAPFCGNRICESMYENCLSCSTDCGICPPNPPAGGGGGGGYILPSSQTTVNFSGKAYPKSTVTLLKDAQIVATTITDENADFSISLTNITSGSYIFSVYSEDKEGNRSSLLTFPLSVTNGVTTNVKNIFIAPTINTDKIEVKKGEIIKIFGQATPNSEITIIINSDEEIYGKTKADQTGAYLYNLDTAELETGDHLAKSRATLEEQISPLSKVVSFKVGTKTVLRRITTKCGKADLNCDGRVNLIDFSIAAYWYKRTLSIDFKTIEKERLNGDNKIDLVDFSIMAYYWTG